MNTSAADRTWETIGALVDRLATLELGRGERLRHAQTGRQLASRLSALSATWLAAADAHADSLKDTGTPTSTLLTLQGLSRREAARQLAQANELASCPEVAQAAVTGTISVDKAKAIHTALGTLQDLSEPQLAQATGIMLNLASGMDSDRLAKAGPQVLAAVIPETADETLERRLQRDTDSARRQRSLIFHRDGRGSVTFRGSLPQTEGEAWIAILDAYTESRRRTALEERDPLATTLTPEQRRADALTAMIGDHHHHKTAPGVGGDRPRVVVTLDYDTLLAGATAAGRIGEGQLLSATELRQLCCDADLLPMVLNTQGAVLDEGREHRLVTPAIRAALTRRDGGCAFPGCDTRPPSCEAHHIQPWWAGGPTTLSNLILLCHSHHALVEPAKYPRDQWEIRLGTDNIPEVLPPRRLDRARTPIRHHRLRPRSPHLSPDDPPGAPPCNPPIAI